MRNRIDPRLAKEKDTRSDRRASSEPRDQDRESCNLKRYLELEHRKYLYKTYFRRKITENEINRCTLPLFLKTDISVSIYVISVKRLNIEASFVTEGMFRLPAVYLEGRKSMIIDQSEPSDQPERPNLLRVTRAGLNEADRRYHLWCLRGNCQAGGPS
ncbi:hypothetical protein K0M31_009407 [Melipona bicolor]|uniref:Uncharacterized protein n=1 Tax=Melipona bicolor TaxID=60889 RepID=A0AA40KJ93_9HYME|nr:hypothetical protein K0M31_009407 [Melipona bicolor]